MKKTKRLTLLILVGFLVVAKILLAILFSQKGAAYAALEKDLADLTDQNQELSSQVAQLTSLSRVSKASPELGLIKPQEVVYLTGDESLAKLS